jgi:hypothetical protein
MRRKTTAEFITDARRVHGDTYDYSLVQYRTAFDRVKIVCKIHGVFQQSATNHSRGKGCSKCQHDNLRFSLYEFLDKAKLIHGEKYDYSLVKYKSAASKIKIICKVHGKFEQKAVTHLRGFGCRKCGHEKLSYTTDEFIIESKKIHGDRYDYSLAKYIHSSKKVKIICKRHGVVEQLPKAHLAGFNCLECRKGTKEEFIKNAIKLHGDKYDYSKVEYKTSADKVVIICKKHGPFFMTPHSHLRKDGPRGCRKCFDAGMTSRGESEFLDYCKIPKKFRNFSIPSTKYVVDGLDKRTKTIFEYLGDYWHGNPKTYDGNTKIRCRGGQTASEAYKKTFERFDKLKLLGYNIKYIWESEWLLWKRGNVKEPKIIDA